MFNMRRLQEAVSEESFIDLNSLCSSSKPMIQQEKNLNIRFSTFEFDETDQHLQLNYTCKYVMDKANKFKQIKIELSSKIKSNLDTIRYKEESILEECQHTCMELKEIEDKVIILATIYEVDK